MRILVGITGGIAAYKSVNLVRLLTESGHDVKVLPTQNALRFIGAATLEAISHNTVDSDLYTDVEQVKHIKLAQDAELVIVAPATAAFIARYANGFADDLLLNVLLATKAQVFIAPAMHTEMWLHQATRDNIETLKSRGVSVLEPAVGRLTGQDSGVGRMLEPDEIFKQLFDQKPKTLTGKHFVIAAGGTQEPIDDVRFIGNRSSGRQGIALAEEVLDRGGQVTFIACNIELSLPNAQKIIQAPTANELREALQNQISQADVVLMPAAVSDFTVMNRNSGKISREGSSRFSLELVQTEDILAGLSKLNSEKSSPAILVGFAAEDASSKNELVKRAESKMLRKGIDIVVANDVTGGKVFGQDSNEVVIIDKTGMTEASGTKREVARSIIDRIEQLLISRHVR